MRNPLSVAAIQFEMAENDKPKNRAVMCRFLEQAAAEKTDVAVFPEMCLFGYDFIKDLSQKQLLAIAEPCEKGPSVTFFEKKAKELDMAILYGLLERDANDVMYNTYVVISPDKGLIFKHRKIHAFENSAIASGNRLDTFELFGWTCGVLICYDNNLPENPRVLALKGAEIIFAPHQTGGFDIRRAGMGKIPLELWKNRKAHHSPMRQAILGPKGYQWITKWLPCRAYDNNLYYVFSNGIGIDGPEVRVGCSLIVDPEGIIMAETTQAGDDIIYADLVKEARVGSLSGSHILSRKPSLYGKITEPAPERNTREIRNSVSNEKIG
ncbi:MAG: nitrilase-related carbon-nitrogen hydrolase [Fibrobacterota bacterium]